MLDAKLRHANLAVCLDEWLWALSSLAMKKNEIHFYQKPISTNHSPIHYHLNRMAVKYIVLISIYLLNLN